MSGRTRRELQKDSSITNQQALVNALLPAGITPIKRLIPGGKTLLETVDKETMPKALYNWLRGCGSFTEAKLCFAKNPEELNLAVTKLESYASTPGKPFWDKPDGRRELANRIANILSTQKRIVYVQAKSDGIYIGQDHSGKFSPKVILTKELQENHEEFSDNVIGDKVTSPDWEPYIEFLPSNRNRYSVFRK